MRNFPFVRSPKKGAQTVLTPSTDALRNYDIERTLAQGLGLAAPEPPVVQHPRHELLDVSSIETPEEPEIVAESEDERTLFELLGPMFNAAAVKATRAQFYGGALALEADITDGYSFAGRPSAEWACSDAFLGRLRDDAARLEAECESAPSYAIGALERSVVELRARIARIERLAPSVFSMRRARRQFERAIELERLAREELSAAEAAAASIVSAPRELLRRAESEADEVIAEPSRRHAEALVARSAAEMALKAAQERV